MQLIMVINMTKEKYCLTILNCRQTMKKIIFFIGHARGINKAQELPSCNEKPLGDQLFNGS